MTVTNKPSSFDDDADRVLRNLTTATAILVPEGEHKGVYVQMTHALREHNRKRLEEIVAGSVRYWYMVERFKSQSMLNANPGPTPPANMPSLILADEDQWHLAHGLLLVRMGTMFSFLAPKPKEKS
jgi:hypothetical protein